MNTVSDIASSLYNSKQDFTDFTGESIVSGIIDYRTCESFGQGDPGHFCKFEDWKITSKRLKIEPNMIVKKKYIVTIPDDYVRFLSEWIENHNSGPRVKVKILCSYRVTLKNGKFHFVGNMIENQDFNYTIHVDFDSLKAVSYYDDWSYGSEISLDTPLENLEDFDGSMRQHLFAIKVFIKNKMYDKTKKHFEHLLSLPSEEVCKEIAVLEVCEVISYRLFKISFADSFKNNIYFDRICNRLYSLWF